jgi:hypothetical protein
VELQWEWLGGTPPLRRAAVVGAGARAAALARTLRDAGLRVEAGRPGADLHLEQADVVVLAVPPRSLAGVLAAHAPGIPARAHVVLADPGVAGPRGELTSAVAAPRLAGSAVVVLGGTGRDGAAPVVASADRGAARQVADLLARAGMDPRRTDDVAGVELAAAAAEAATLAAATAAAAGVAAAGSAAAGRILEEVASYARERGSRPETFTRLAGDGAGALGAARVAPAAPTAPVPGDEAREAVGPLAAALAADGRRAPVLRGLAAVVSGDREADEWAAELAGPDRGARPVPARAA